MTGAEAREDIKVEGPWPGHRGGETPAGLREQTRQQPARETVTDRSGHAGARLCRACGPAAGWIFFQKQREAVGWFRAKERQDPSDPSQRRPDCDVGSRLEAEKGGGREASPGDGRHHPGHEPGGSQAGREGLRRQASGPAGRSGQQALQTAWALREEPGPGPQGGTPEGQLAHTARRSSRARERGTATDGFALRVFHPKVVNSGNSYMHPSRLNNFKKSGRGSIITQRS